MALLEEKIAEIKDPELRRIIEEEVKALKKDKPFGLVFERHQPEVAPLYQARITRRETVAKRAGNLTETYRVESIHAGQAHLIKDSDDSRETVPLADLVVVRRMGEPIYPALIPRDHISTTDTKTPHHILIEADNYHALQLLGYVYAGKVDCIYIDPPYNTGARDWKYNNDYVDAKDAWRHSKWLSMMERRLKLVKRLLNPTDSVLIVTIDEKEYLRLGLLLEQMFPEARIQMVSITTNPKGASRPDLFARVDEFAYFVLIGDATVSEIGVSDSQGQPVRWPYLRRSDDQSVRGHRPRQFYAVFVDPVTSKITGVGEPLAHDVARESFLPPPGVVAVFPVRDDGVEMEWGLTGPSLMRAVRGGFARATRTNSLQPYAISYLTAPAIGKVESGEYIVSDIREDGTKVVIAPGGKTTRPTTVWNESRHSAPDHGKKVLGALLPKRSFPFPKSLYVVEDTLRLFAANKKNATILDFFSGSGTTAHAVMRLNRQDGGQRQCISVTNNEVAADEQKALTEQGLKPGHPDWEKWGICNYITFPRIKAAITGLTPEGEPIQGDYKFTDEFPIADGFPANLDYFKLDFLQPADVAMGRQFAAILPVLWMKAGAGGPCPEPPAPNAHWLIPADCPFVVLMRESRFREFLEKVRGRADLTHVYLVTNSDSAFHDMRAELPDHLEIIQLYKSYLENFRINSPTPSRSQP